MSAGEQSNIAKSCLEHVCATAHHQFSVNDGTLSANRWHWIHWYAVNRQRRSRYAAVAGTDLFSITGHRFLSELSWSLYLIASSWQCRWNTQKLSSKKLVLRLIDKFNKSVFSLHIDVATVSGSLSVKSDQWHAYRQHWIEPCGTSHVRVFVYWDRPRRYGGRRHRCQSWCSVAKAGWDDRPCRVLLTSSKEPAASRSTVRRIFDRTRNTAWLQSNE